MISSHDLPQNQPDFWYTIRCKEEIVTDSGQGI